MQVKACLLQIIFGLSQTTPQVLQVSDDLLQVIRDLMQVNVI